MLFHLITRAAVTESRGVVRSRQIAPHTQKLGWYVDPFQRLTDYANYVQLW